jgi:hypothetical protein
MGEIRSAVAAEDSSVIAHCLYGLFLCTAFTGCFTGKTQIAAGGPARLSLYDLRRRLVPLGNATVKQATDEPFLLRVAAQSKRAWKGKRIIVSERTAQKADPQCLKLLQEAFAARALILSEGDESLTAIAGRLGKCQVRLTGLVRLSYLAPSIIGELISGRHPIGLSAKRLLKRSKDLPVDWQQQRLAEPVPAPFLRASPGR